MSGGIATLNWGRPKIFYGWWIVLVSGTVQFYTSAVFWRGFQAFVEPVLRTYTGWGSGVFGAAMAIQRAESSFITPFVGAAVDRFGPRPVLAFGAFVTGCGFILMSQMQELWHFYAAMLVLGIGLSFGEFIVFVATIVNWFVRNRSRALAAFMTFSATGAIALPLLVWAIDSFGWRTVLFCVGIGFWVIATPALLILRRRPEDYGMRSDGDSEIVATDPNLSPRRRDQGPEVSIGIRDVLRLRAFWQIVIAVSIGEVVAMTNLYHLPALIEYELDLWLASIAAGAVAIGDILGRITIGIIGDRYPRQNAASYRLVFPSCRCWFPRSNQLRIPWHLLGALPRAVLCVLLRLRIWCIDPAAPLDPRRILRKREANGTLVGTASSFSSICVTCGLLFVGFMSDFTDSYRPGYTVLTLLLLADDSIDVDSRISAACCCQGSANGAGRG